MFLERDPCLRRATEVVATEVGQVKQTVTLPHGKRTYSVMNSYWVFGV